MITRSCGHGQPPRDLRVRLGLEVVGYVGSCLPPSGPVQMLVLSKVQVFDGSKNVIARYDELPLVPNNLVGFRITEGPSARVPLR
jgi:hypothetical protein